MATHCAGPGVADLAATILGIDARSYGANACQHLAKKHRCCDPSPHMGPIPGNSSTYVHRFATACTLVQRRAGGFGCGLSKLAVLLDSCRAWCDK